MAKRIDPAVVIAEAVVQLQLALRSVGVEPAIIEVGSSTSGAKLEQVFLGSPNFKAYGPVVDGVDQHGEARRHIEVAGTIVRWPPPSRGAP